MAQGTPADYERSRGLRAKFQNLALDVPGPVNWIGGTSTFWYRKTVKGGAQFVLVDATKQEKRPAFDHEKVAAALGAKYTAVTLPSLSSKTEPQFHLSRGDAPQRGGGGGRNPEPCCRTSSYIT